MQRTIQSLARSAPCCRVSVGRGHRKGPAISRRADNVAVIVNRHSDSVRVAAEGREFVDVAVLPGDRLELEQLWGRAVSIWGGILRSSDRLAPIVDDVRPAVVATERRERSHPRKLPQERETASRRGKSVRFKSAKVLPIGVWGVGFGLTNHLAPFVEVKRHTVRSSKAGFADVQLQRLVPENGRHRATRGDRCATNLCRWHELAVPKSETS